MLICLYQIKVANSREAEKGGGGGNSLAAWLSDTDPSEPAAARLQPRAMRFPGLLTREREMSVMVGICSGSSLEWGGGSGSAYGGCMDRAKLNFPENVRLVSTNYDTIDHHNFSADRHHAAEIPSSASIGVQAPHEIPRSSVSFLGDISNNR
ncbi:hypothetical protein SAY87_028812 [Trapa incisa]|uniref:Uncharacterized protein n=1 Tax=Trapa incisa TaxID=236973 RepID=A0AAN7QS00_9MYRT|nr:hypothetical protein SAY87_028812 [Trapa incisa]